MAIPNFIEATQGKIRMYRFDVPGMKCGSCARKIEGAVKARDVSAEFSADVANRRVTVISSMPQVDLAAAIQEAGYTNHVVVG